MEDKSVNTDLTWYGRATYIIAAVGAAVAASVICGWVLHIRPLITVLPGTSSMAATTGLNFLLASCGVFFLKRRAGTASLCGYCIALVSVGAIYWFFTHTSHPLTFPLHQHPVVSKTFPTGKMSPNAAIVFLLLSCALVFADRPDHDDRPQQRIYAFQVFALAVSFVAFIGLIAHASGVLYVFGVSHILGMALITCIMFILVSSGVLVARPDRGIMVLWQRNSIAGRSIRRLMPLAFVAPLILGTATVIALRVHAGYGLLLSFLVVVGSMVLLAILIWSNTLALQDQVQRAEEYQAKIAEIERKKIEDALEESQDQLGLALEGAQLGTWHWDLVTGIRVWSDQCKKLLGLPLDTDMTPETINERVHPDDWTKIEAARETAIASNSVYAVEYRVIWPDNTIHWIDSRGKAYCGEDGRAVRFEGISQDVSMQHLMQERQQQFLRDMLAGVTDAKLTLCLGPKDMPLLYRPIGKPVPITVSNGGIRNLRESAYDACVAARQPLERCYDMKTAVGEAAMNSAVHAESGIGEIFAGDNGTVQVKVTDHGSGIALENLPKAALKKGYTTAGTFGHGMKMMLQTVDRVYLMTGTDGTTVVLEQDRMTLENVW
jgi:PAS domain-containing protein/anti-sigma regulatory factor (Ser/Thr protein kinase)